MERYHPEEQNRCVTQLVEFFPDTEAVAGSSPVTPTNSSMSRCGNWGRLISDWLWLMWVRVPLLLLNVRMPEWSKGADCKPVEKSIVCSNHTPDSIERWLSGLKQHFAKVPISVSGSKGSNPFLSTYDIRIRSLVWLKLQTHNLKIAGSSPAGSTMKYNRQQHKLETKEDSFEEIDRFLNYWDYDYDDWCNDYDAVCDYCGVWSCYQNDNVYKCSGKIGRAHV